MNSQSQSRLASILTFGVGAWLMASPLVFSVSGAALANVLIVGGILAVAGVVQLFWDSTVPSWIAAITAVWLVVSAFMFNADTGFVWSALLSAVAAFGLAVWDGVEVTHIQDTGHKAAA